MLREFIFIDSCRVETYFDQITAGAERLIAERVSTWGVAAGLPKFGIEGKEATQFREQTLIEKVNRVEEFISRDVRPGFIPNRSDFDEFGYIAMTARKAVIPMAESVLVGRSRIILWLPDLVEAKAAGLSVYLLEEGGDHDPRSRMLDWCSSLTALEFLAKHLLFRQIGSLTYTDICDQHLDRIFVNDPIVTMRALGGDVFSSRRIRALYRTRCVFGDLAVPYPEPETTGVIGYPIYIEALPAA